MQLKPAIILCALSVALFFLSAACGQQPVNKQPQEVKAMGEQANIGKPFPPVTAKTLEDNEVTVPDAARGRVTLVAVAFLQQSQAQLDSWLNPFYEKFGDRDDFMFYEVPMISKGYIFMKPIIDRGMRGGLPEFKRKHVVTLYGDVEYYTRELQIDPALGHAFLLDKDGVIRFQDKGFATPEALEEMYSLAAKLAQ